MVPCTPCYNKFNKILPSLSHFAAFTHLPSNSGVKAWRHVVGNNLRGSNKDEDEKNLRSATGYMNTEQFSIHNRVRLRKSFGFVGNVSVADKALASTMTLQISVALLGSNFSEARLDPNGKLNLYGWMGPDSPVIKTVENI